MNIRIADLPISWQDGYDGFVKGFEDEAEHEPVLSVEFADRLPECHGIQYADMPSEHVLRQANGELLFANSDWSKATACFTPKLGGEYALPLAAICSRFSCFGAFLLHASFVTCGENGVLFTGFSGVGKTTQAELWQKHLGAEIVNGDKAFVRFDGGEFYACGLPWKGSSDYCLNRKAPLRAVIVLRQAKENRIKKLRPTEAMEFFLPHVFLPHWDEKCLNQTLDTFEKVLQSVPVMLLECRADEDAVRLAYNTVLG